MEIENGRKRTEHDNNGSQEKNIQRQRMKKLLLVSKEEFLKKSAGKVAVHYIQNFLQWLL
ncbi:hypothetical protein THYS13_22000 [Thermoanaerobacter sp. YS13]|nr:hypothetical protein THYS13_22000 [Thermoanaerobacter sp. YS13]